MFAMKSNLVILLICFHVTNCSRRIQNGVKLSPGTVKSYVVYIVRAPIASSKYDYWMCGGALVTSVFVVTSAACIDDVNYLYVIAGYATYVNDSNIDKDPCTSAKKKKVIFTCCPAGYDVKYDQLERWSFVDIGVVKVESPYDFNDNSFKTLCSYIPTTIPINYESKYQEPGTDALVFGWGHLFEWRKESDKSNYNQRELHYAPVLLMDKEACKKQYEVYNNMSAVIDKYMICSNGTGNINDQGAEIIRTTPDPMLFLNCRGEESCDEDDISYDDIMYNSRKHIKESNNTYTESTTEIVNRSTISDKQDVDTTTFKISRRNGICQNDHGGPIVTYIGTHEVLIGVASVFKVGEDSTCIGPFLYTSTHCNGAFLNCVLTYKDWPNEKNRTRRSVCKKKENNEVHATIHRHISWADHPAGPSDDDNHRNGAYSHLTVKHKPVAPPTFNDRHAKESYVREKNIGRHNPEYESNMNNNAHGNYTANVMDGPYGSYAANGMDTSYGNHAANIMNAQHSNHAPNIMNAQHNNHAPNIMNAQHNNHPPNVMGSAYYGNYGGNVRNEPNEKYSQDKFAVKQRYKAENNPQTVKIDNDRLIMRPQRPLHS